MLKTRVIPCLLLKNDGLVKTVKFKAPTYLGDPINIVKIFNEKEVDELVFLDITATLENRKPPFKKLSEIASECFMPVGYGGGIRSLDDIREILALGIEKVIINSYASENPNFIENASKLFGSQSIVVSIDVKKDYFGKYKVVTHSCIKRTKADPVKYAIDMQDMGAGEILLNSVDRDGMMKGYDIELIRTVSKAVTVPVIACGGAGKIDDFKEAVRNGGASAVAAGSFFVFQGRHRAVLISYPSYEELTEALC
ncbi:Imidazole glycerol phosphate synthase cyclase subunit [Olavius sp. associated proteobacterium Delta 1]|nr:Imidazole glycerol phosphate synthase cyclase subunit [Olavius sp. associated proteobacterium Delta 1]